MGRLWDIAERYMDEAEGVISERELASRLGYKSSSTFDAWRSPKKLPAAEGLARLALLTGVPYRDVLEAALTDCAYLPTPEVELPDPRVLYKRGRHRATHVDRSPEVIAARREMEDAREWARLASERLEQLRSAREAHGLRREKGGDGDGDSAPTMYEPTDAEFTDEETLERGGQPAPEPLD